MDQIGEEQFLTRPGTVQDLDQLRVGLHGVLVVPELLEPFGQELGGGDVGDVYVQLALFAQARSGEVR